MVKRRVEEESAEEEYVDFPKYEKIQVKYIPKDSGLLVGNKEKHVASGGFYETGFKLYTVPMLTSGHLKKILTDAEQETIEEYLQLPAGTMNFHAKLENNYWADTNDAGVSTVRLTKDGAILDLSDPYDYLRYKILLANSDKICPSLDVLEKNRKATYEFVIIREGETAKQASQKMSTLKRCLMEYGKVENDKETLIYIAEALEGKMLDPNTKIEFLQGKMDTLITSDSKNFLKVITDPYLPTKVLIKKALSQRLIVNKGNYLYLAEDNSPLCANGEEPTIEMAAKYLNAPKNQQLLLSLKAKLKD